MILDAVHRGADPILIGLGGSATVDGGIGAATALGMLFENGVGERPIQPQGLPKLRK